MIIIDKPRMRFLLAGRTLTVETTNPTQYRKGRNYSVGVRHNRTVCRVEILHIDETSGTIQIRQQILQAEPNLLARYSQYGYTSNPAQAMFGEPEAPTHDQLEQARRWERQEAGTALPDRIRVLERRAHQGDQQAQRHLFVIQQRLLAAEQRRAREVA